LWYDFERRASLGTLGWRFASRTASLEQRAPDDASDDRTYYQLPTDFIRINAVRSSNGYFPQYFVEGSRLYIPYVQALLQVGYVFDQQDTLTFSALFEEYLIARLAHRIALGTQAGPDKTRQIEKLIASAKLEAVSMEGAQAQTIVTGSNSNMYSRARLWSTGEDGDTFYVVDEGRYG
jgi:hypothetical protein